MYDMAAAQDRDPIGTADHLTDPVRDQADADATGCQVAHTTDEALHLVRPKHRCRFVQQQEAGVLRQCYQQLAHLPLDKRHPAGRRVERYGNAGSLGGGRELAACSPQIGAYSLLSEKIVLDQVSAPTSDRFCGRKPTPAAMASGAAGTIVG